MKAAEHEPVLRASIGERGLAFTAFVGVFFCYLPTLAHYLPGGDAGDLAAAACQSAVAHPPGYPLWVLLAKGMLFFPLGGIILRLSLMSALLGSGAAALIAASLWRLQLFWPLTLVGAALFSFASNTWLFAVTPEVFALNSLLVMASFYAAVRAAPSAIGRWHLLCGLAAGLALANHHTSAALCGPIAISSLLGERSLASRVKGLMLVLSGVLLGVLPYVYLPLAGAGQSIYGWGDTTTFAGFWQHLLRTDYGTFKLASARTSASLGHNLWLYGTYLMKESCFLAPLLLVLGLFGLFRRKVAARGPLRWAALLTVVYLLLFHAAANLYLEYDLHQQVLSRFWIMPQLIVAMVSAIGLDEIARWREGWLRRPLLALSFALVLLLPLLRYQSVDVSGDEVMERFAQADFAAMPAGSIALVRDDLSFPLSYLKACEGVRPDVRLINRAFLTREWGRIKVSRAYSDVVLPSGLYTYQKIGGEEHTYDLTDFLESNIDRHPIFLHEFAPGMEEYEVSRGWAGRFDILPWGMLTRIERHKPGRDLARHDEENRRLLQLYVPPLAGGPDKWSAVVRLVYVDAFYLRAMYLTRAQLIDPNLFPLALAALDEAATQPDQPMARIYSLKGFVYAIEAGRDPKALELAFEAWRDYLRVAPEDDPARKQIEDRLLRMKGTPSPGG